MSVVRRHTIVILRAPEIDDGRGNTARDWSSPVETESKGWAIDAGSTVEDAANRDGAGVEYTLRGPFDADVASTDRVRLWGDVFEVEGQVLRQPGSSPLTSHTILRLSAWKG